MILGAFNPPIDTAEDNKILGYFSTSGAVSPVWPSNLPASQTGVINFATVTLSALNASSVITIGSTILTNSTFPADVEFRFFNGIPDAGSTGYTPQGPRHGPDFDMDFEVVGGGTIEILTKNNGGGIQVEVDGVYRSPVLSLAGDGTGTYNVVITLDQTVRTRIVLRTTNSFLLVGIRINENVTLFNSPELLGPPTVFIGDDHNSWVAAIGRHLKLNGYDQPVAGTGYVNAGTYHAYGWRVADYAASLKPALVVLYGGNYDGNISGSYSNLVDPYTLVLTQSTIAAVNSVRTNCPGAKIVIVGPKVLSQDDEYVRDAIAGGAIASRVQFIDLVNVSAQADDQLAAYIAPQIFEVLSGEVVSVSFSWPVITGAVLYVVSGAISLQAIGPGALAPNLEPARFYVVCVMAYDSSGRVLASAVKRFRTPATSGLYQVKVGWTKLKSYLA